MKVKSLFIKDFNQFKDFELDLTYPAGHAKAGLPLDKVCIIGQSGTGKTSLLLFLKNLWGFLIQSAFFPIEDKNVSGYINSLPHGFKLLIRDSTEKSEFIIKNDSYDFRALVGQFQRNFNRDALDILYFPSEVELLTWGATQLTFNNFWSEIAQDIQKYQEREMGWSSNDGHFTLQI